MSIVLARQDILHLVSSSLVHARVGVSHTLSYAADLLATGSWDCTVVVGMWMRARHKAGTFTDTRCASVVRVVRAMRVVMTVMSCRISCEARVSALRVCSWCVILCASRRASSDATAVCIAPHAGVWSVATNAGTRVLSTATNAHTSVMGIATKASAAMILSSKVTPLAAQSRCMMRAAGDSSSCTSPGQAAAAAMSGAVARVVWWVRDASGRVLCSRTVECLLLTQFLVLGVAFAAARELLFDFANETHDDSMCVGLVGLVGVSV